LSQFTIEEEGQRENVPGVVPVRRQQPTVQTTNLSGSSPRKKSQQKRVSNNKEASSFLLKPEREGGGYVSGVLPLIRQVHFERTNTMSSHATFVVENNSRRPLIANDGFENVIASLKGNTLIEEHCQRIVQQNFQQLKIANGNEDIEILQNSCEMLIIEEIPSNFEEEINFQSTSTEINFLDKQIQQQTRPNTTTIKKEITKMFSSKLGGRTQNNRKQEKRLGKEILAEKMEESIGGVGGGVDEVLVQKNYYEEKEYTAAFAARPKIRRTPPKLPDEGLLDEE
uniref:Uncharacterized protein n=1 Tax=Meloidogyne floridensis TaxID=298350 RepID=A0A915NL11_9BILA